MSTSRSADHLHQWWEDPSTKEWCCSLCGVRFGEPGGFVVREHIGPTSTSLVAMSYVHLGGRQLAVYNVLKDGEWHDGPELTHPEVGGSEGLRRLRELREKGYTIEMRRKAKGRTTRQYRLVR